MCRANGGERKLRGARARALVREVGVLVSTIVSLIAPIALDFGINAPCLLFSRGISLPSALPSLSLLLARELAPVPVFPQDPALLYAIAFLAIRWARGISRIGTETTFNSTARRANVPPFDLGEKSPVAACSPPCLSPSFSFAHEERRLEARGTNSSARVLLCENVLDNSSDKIVRFHG